MEFDEPMEEEQEAPRKNILGYKKVRSFSRKFSITFNHETLAKLIGRGEKRTFTARLCLVLNSPGGDAFELKKVKTNKNEVHQIER